ncbi:MAG: hypothetical protein HYU41_10030 [Candidatus Rokubacteria bacterium]|nr:hypothetical protein [Candidatus Rokubacteria bacterium]
MFRRCSFRTISTVLLTAAVFAGCASVPKSTPLLLSAEPTAIVLATAIIAPEALVTVVSEAVKAAPESAVVLAAAATAGAPDQALAIRAAVVRLAPLDAAAIVAVTTVKRRGPVIARLSIPNPDSMLSLLERATQ